MSSASHSAVAPLEPHAEAPTRVRHGVLLVVTLTSFLLYLDRYCFSLAEKYIRDDLRLETWQTSWLHSAFFLSYALAQVPSGWFSDRFGARAMLTLYVLTWSLFTGICGLVTGFWMFLALRVGFGLGQAGAYPTAGGLLSKWAPYSSRGTANAIVALGGRVGGALAPVLTAVLIVLFVPADRPSTLAPDDLLSPGVWIERITAPVPAETGNSSASQQAAALAEAGQQILAACPTELREQVQAAGQAQRDWLELAKTGESSARPAVPAGLIAELLVPLNQRLDGPPLLLLDPERYPKVLIEKEAQRILKQDPDARTPGQRARLNRLTLEAISPELRRVYSRGWRPTMAVYGMLGLIVAGAFWVMFRNTPAEHPRTNAAERALIAGTSPAPTGKAGSLPLAGLVSNFSLWLMCLSQFTTNFGWLFVVSWLPRYLDEVHNEPIATRGMMTMVPLLVGCAGMYVGGPFTDRMTHRMGKRWGRSLPLALTRFLAMASFLACLLPLTGWQVAAAMAVMAVAVDLGVPATWAYAQDVGGRYTSSIMGWGNMWGNFGAALSPVLLDRLIGKEGAWHAAFLACAISFLVSGVASIGIDATKPVAE